MDTSQAPGGESLNKAALLILTLDKSVLAKVLKHLSTEELARLRRVYEQHASGGLPPHDQFGAFCKEFLEDQGPQSSNHFKEALALALGPQEAERITHRDRWTTMSERVEPEALAGLLKGERPEAVAIVLSQLPSRYAAKVVSCLPEELRGAAVERLARNERIPPSALDAILSAIQESFKNRNQPDTGARDAGVKRAAALLNQLDTQIAKPLLDRLRTADADRAKAIEQELFHFEDFLKLDDRTLQRTLSEIRPERLALALKGISDSDRQPVLAALTDQVKQAVLQEIKDSGKVPMRDVKAARAEVTSLALQMERDGKIRLKPEETTDLVE